MSHYIELEQHYAAHNYLPLPVVLTKGEGCYLWDEDGKRYIDMMSAYSAVSFGHHHPEIIKAMKDQLDELAVTSRAFYNDKLGPFMKALCEISGFDQALPMNTGAEAVETAIKAARIWAYRVKNIPHHNAKIIVADNNFHGRTTTIVGFSTEESYRRDFGPYDGGFVSIPFNDANALEHAITEDTAAFMVEPMQGEAGIVVPDQGWLSDVAEICKRHNVLLIVDEVQTGFGRTGKPFAYMHEIAAPDAMIVGKALGGGVLPVSALVGKKHVMELFTPGSHGSTFGGNPLACTVATKAIELLQTENLVENSARLGAYMKEKLEAMNSPLIRDVRGVGLWVGVDINPDITSARHICEELMRAGFLSKETHETVVRLAPPLNITKEIIDDALTIFKQVLDDAAC